MAVEPGVVMSAEEMSALSKKHTMFDWVPQDAVVPVPIEYAKGVYMYTPDGQRILDFNSQLMSVNIGHGDQRVIDAITAQAQKVCYVHPYTATEPRAALGRKLAQITPGDLDVWFFTNGGAEANENAIRIARHYTGRQKILARSRSYHGAVGSTIVATGDPRRWGAEIGVSGIVRAPDFHKWGRPDPEPVDVALRELEEVIMYEGPGNIAGFILEPIVGTNGILIPPDGYMQGVRDICDQHGIMLIADEVMSGFGRTGEWFAVDIWGIEPDLMSIAKGLTSSYVQLGALGMSRKVADTWGDKPFPAGLTYNSHALACATALAVIDVYEQDDLIARAKRMGEVMAGHHARLAEKHPSVGRTRNQGMFGIIELVRSTDPWEPMAPYNGTSDEMKAVGAYLKEHGLFTFLRFGMIHTNPPLIITEDEMAEGFDIIDGALELADKGVRA
ncbi:MAG: aminotransferase class III-fold pyridoxal phosphate-dependent enzyme [Candidatus Limnocylindrales bacterium]